MSLDIWLTHNVCPCCGQGKEGWSDNYTSNVTPMWKEAGVYDALYFSEGKTTAEVVIAVSKGVLDMEENPEKYRAMNPPNGWGDYDSALKFLQEFLIECAEDPDAVIGVSK